MKIVRLIIVAEPIKRTCSSSEITRSTFRFMHERTLTSCLSLIVFTFCSSILFFLQKDWQTVDTEAFTIRANNQRSFSLKEGIEEGNYNVLMQNQPLYNSNAHTFESSHDLFRSAFDQGFPWELIEVFSGNWKISVLRFVQVSLLAGNTKSSGYILIFLSRDR